MAQASHPPCGVRTDSATKEYREDKNAKPKATGASHETVEPATAGERGSMESPLCNATLCLALDNHRIIRRAQNSMISNSARCLTESSMNRQRKNIAEEIPNPRPMERADCKKRPEVVDSCGGQHKQTRTNPVKNDRRPARTRHHLVRFSNRMTPFPKSRSITQS